ncbi:MAG: VOC family protein [Rhodospirillaceae bacterium]|nr:VOC family protein [Rhodospirillaceae bacterium]
MPATLSLKRTTILVRDAKRLMEFYRDVLGWRTDYESTMKLSGGLIPCGKPGDEVLLYIMGGPDKDVGKVGLLEWINPRLPDPHLSNPGPPKYRLGIGDILFVADVPDMTALVKRIEAFPGARIHSYPKDETFPDPKGNGVLSYAFMSFFDPEGFFHETYFRYNRPNPEQFLIRRTTCITRDVARSLAFFNDGLGLATYQDSTMQIEGALPAGKKGDTVRFVVAKCEHDYIGMVGAVQFLRDPLADPGTATWDYGIGRAMFVAGCADANALFAQVKARGVRITREPFDRTVPLSGGAGTVAIRSFGFHDPDGFLWEVSQRL